METPTPTRSENISPFNPASSSGADVATGSDDSSANVKPLEVLEAALREVFVKMMTLVDEEDAVLLYRCTRLAEASPLLLEACDQRRLSIEDGLAEKLNLLWQGTRPRLLEAIERNSSTAAKGLDKHERAILTKELENSRKAGALRDKHTAIERQAAVREALRLREEETQRTIETAQEECGQKELEHKARADREIAEARANAQKVEHTANMRVKEREQALVKLQVGGHTHSMQHAAQHTACKRAARTPSPLSHTIPPLSHSLSLHRRSSRARRRPHRA